MKSSEEHIEPLQNYFWEAHDAMLCRKFGFDELLKR
jgi:hypothetical protein